MKTFRNYILTERNLTMPKDNIPSSWFTENGFPMIVRCACCGMTMATPSAYIDEHGYTYCSDCIDEEDLSNDD